MIVDLYDSVNWRAIPTTAPIVAGYANGLYEWPQQAWDRFPSSVKLRISVSPWLNDGHILDCEKGDALPWQCPAWIRMRIAAGLVRPCIYCPFYSMVEVMRACSGLPYCLWVAWWTGRDDTHITGASAIQYSDPPGSGGDFDVTRVLDLSWPYQIWGATGPGVPVPPATPKPPNILGLKETSMRFVTEGTQQHIAGVDSAGRLRHWWNDVSAGVQWNANDPVSAAGTPLNDFEPYAPCDMVVIPIAGTSQINLVAPTRHGALLHVYQALGDPHWTVETLA